MPRSTLSTLKFPLPQGRAPLFFLLVQFHSSNNHHLPVSSILSLRVGVLCSTRVHGSRMKGPVECTVSLFLNQSINQHTATNPFKGHMPGRSKSSQVRSTETKASLFQLTVTTLLPGIT